MTEPLSSFFKPQSNLASALSEIPQVKRSKVWCHTCGRVESISAVNFSTGWPKCCGYTMTIDSPEEQKRLAAKAS